MLVVKDTGPGIPKDEIPRVLQAFGQGSIAHETSEGGTGLGLPLVQSLVNLHGGRFRLRSALRKGTEAVVWLPPCRVLDAGPKRPADGSAHPDAPGDVLAGPRPAALPETDSRWWQRTGSASQQATTGC
jgi:two-component system cell cycle sensor histidine kinase PleC